MPVQVVLQDPDAADKDARQFIGFLAALALYVTLAIYGNWILTGIVEEKASRVVEVLLGLVRPYELLAGKTLGILVVAVGQLAIAVVGAIVGLVIVGKDSLPSVALDVVLAAIPLYVFGLLLYSMIYAAAGATVSRQSDAQSAATPIVMLLLVPYMFSAAFVPQNPDGLAATILSIFPLTSPLVMPARVANGSPGDTGAGRVLRPPLTGDRAGRRGRRAHLRRRHPQRPQVQLQQPHRGRPSSRSGVLTSP